MKNYLVIFLPFALSACIYNFYAPNPMTYISYKSTQKTKTIFIFLPGRSGTASDFYNERFVQIVKDSHLPVDILSANAYYGYYIDKTFLKRFDTDIIQDIIKKGYQKNGAGNYLKIRHNSIYTTQYAHLSRFARGMKIGKHVRQDQLIGYVGHTGLATGPHLDFRFYKYGKPVNPLTVKSPPARPVAPAYRPAFDSVVRHYRPLLDSL